MEYKWTLNVADNNILKNSNFKYGSTDLSFPTTSRAAYWGVNVISGSSQWLFGNEKAFIPHPANSQTGLLTQEGLINGGNYTVRIKVDAFNDNFSGNFLRVKLGTNLIGSINGTGPFVLSGVSNGQVLTIEKEPSVAVEIDYVICEYDDEVSDVVVKDPVNWRSIRYKIQRDKLLRGIFRKFSISPRWAGDAYDQIKTWVERYGIETEIYVKCEYRCDACDDFEELFEGSLFAEDLRENLQACEFSSSIEFSSALSKLLKNKDVDVNLYSNTSLNGFAITPLTQRTVTASILGDSFKAWLVHDVFDFLVRYLTDGELGFESELFGNPTDHGYAGNGDYFLAAFTFGNELRDITVEEQANINFKNFFQEIRSLYATAAVLDETGPSPVLKIIKEYELFDQFTGQPFVLDRIPNLNREIYQDNRFATADFGFSTYQDELDETTDPVEYWATLNLSFLGNQNNGQAFDRIVSGIASENIIKIKLAESAVSTDKFEYDENYYHLYLDSRFNWLNNSNLRLGPIVTRWVPLVYESMIIEGWTGKSNFQVTTNPNRTIKDFGDDPVTPDDLYLWYKYVFDYPMILDNLSSYLTSPELGTTISPGLNAVGLSRFAYLEELSYNLETGLTKFTMISES